MKQKRRLLICAINNNQYKKDNYIQFLVSNLAQISTNIVFVSEKLIQNSCLRYNDITDFFSQKEKISFGSNKTSNYFELYRKGLKYIGFKNLTKYDEVIFLNDNLYGPIFPLDEIFEKINNKKDINFWGLSRQFDTDIYKRHKVIRTIPEHLQTDFIVIKNKMLQDSYFKEFWSQDFSKFEDYQFTQYFTDKGFKWETCIDCRDLESQSNNPLIMCPIEMIKKGCPFISRKIFTTDKDEYLHNTTGETASNLLSYLETSGLYDTNLIWDDLLKNENQYDIKNILNLSYTLSTTCSNNPKKQHKIAGIFHIYFPDLLGQTIKYINSLPNYADIYITTSSVEKKQAIEEAMQKQTFNKYEVRVIKNRGRDVSALLVGVKDIIMDYDLVCFAHDKKTNQTKPGSVGVSFGYKCFENILSNADYVNNVICTFEDNPRLGLLAPPEPNHGPYFPIIGLEWGPNYENTVALAKKLNINVPIKEEKPPVAPYGSMFWFRPKALKPLFNYGWDYEDFPPEPLKVDGAISHAIERIHPYVAQSCGYYPATCMTDKFSAIEYCNLRHYLRGYNKPIEEYGNSMPYYKNMKKEHTKAYYAFFHNGALTERFCFNILIKPYRQVRSVYRKLK